MRWRFIRGASEIETAARARVESKISRFWSAFTECSADLEALFAGRAEFDVPQFMADHLEAIDPRLMWEFGPAPGGHRLVITPEGARHLEPMVSRLLSLAPSLPGWKFLAHRPPERLENVQALLEARTGRRFCLDRVALMKGQHARIDLSFVPARGVRIGSDLEEQAFIAAELLAGEKYLDDWIGTIEVVPEADGAVPIERLYPRLSEAILDMRERLPDQPIFRMREQLTWSVYQVGDDSGEEDAGRCDLFVGRTAIPDLFVTAHARAPFSSSRFSRCGELFCYVKLDVSDSDPGTQLRDRVTVEEHLDEVLVHEGLGTVIGGANGRVYSYVDLAVVEPEVAFERAKLMLRELGAPRRSWILFFDDHLAGEWVPIWDDSPRPPGLPS